MDRKRARRELDLLNYDKVLLFAGRIQPIKGLDLLLRAVTHLPDGRKTRLLVVGGNADGADELVRLNSLVSELGIGDKVTFMGVMEHERMPLFYNAADVCVIPSYHESFGLVAVEALATGTPVVASRVGGLATIVKDGETGYLVDELSPEAFALHLRLLLGDEEVRQLMAEAARPSVVKYDWSLMTRRVLRVYEEQVGA
jgi:D-inositol-3-phosphate glycosyltransferase